METNMKLNKIILGLTLSTVVGMATAAGYDPRNSGDSTQVDEMPAGNYNTGVTGGYTQQEQQKCELMSECMKRFTGGHTYSGNTLSLRFKNENNVSAVVSNIKIVNLSPIVGKVQNLYFSNGSSTTLVGQNLSVNNSVSLSSIPGRNTVQPDQISTYVLSFENPIYRRDNDKYWIVITYSDGSSHLEGLMFV